MEWPSVLSDLPARRVIPSRPFLHVGIDYFGPITIRSPSDDLEKAYGIILTCTVTRLLHLECVPDMSTQQLLNALRRFFARRGVPETITSDNGPYFSLADQILNDAASQIANDTTVAKVMAAKGILWRTITPYAPWQGSFYERLIKSIKHSLYKTLGKTIVSMDNLNTLLIEIERTADRLTFAQPELDHKRRRFAALRSTSSVRREFGNLSLKSHGSENRQKSVKVNVSS
ncbi:hypothetical protein Q1695_016284 [Nippostrongylus brasiliensis]|nr:hypothetical protein Q1695_016284 [Nippostrongylus brasiliensis]